MYNFVITQIKFTFIFVYENEKKHSADVNGAAVVIQKKKLLRANYENVYQMHFKRT